MARAVHTEEIHTFTIVGENGVNYSVERYRPNLGVCEELWSKTVLFGRDKAHRAGGPAFRVASEEQEQQLRLARAGEYLNG